MDESTETTTSSGGGKKWGFVGALAILAIVALPLWFFMIGPMLRHDRLVEKGKPAYGRILSVDETGTYVNDSPELELIVEFTHDGKLDTASTDFVPTLRTLHMYQPGVQVKIAYDPEDPKEFTILELNSSPTSTTTTSTSTTPGVNTDSLIRAADSLQRELQKLKGGK